MDCSVQPVVKIVPQGAPSTDGVPVVLSVPHTGTRFTKNLLGGAEHRHTLELSSPAKWLKAHENRIVVSLRNPSTVWESWAKRRKTSVTNFDRAWAYLWRALEFANVLWLPVDHVDRENYLQKIADHFGMVFETDWAPITEWNGHPAGAPPFVCPEKDLSDIYKKLLLEGIKYVPN